MIFSFIGIYILLQIAFAQIEDYCANKTLCPPDQLHISCIRHNISLSKCPKNRTPINLVKHRDVILRLHNERRNLLAGGDLYDYPPASRMTTMQWDNELALIAAYHVKGCTLRNDYCQNTDTYINPGQIAALQKYKGEQTFSAIDRVQYILDVIIKEHKKERMRDYILHYPAKEISGVTPFLQLITDSNNRVGCAATSYTYDDDEFTNFLLVCKYSIRKKAGEVVYVQGPPASDCLSGQHSLYENLCTKNEVYETEERNYEVTTEIYSTTTVISVS